MGIKNIIGKTITAFLALPLLAKVVVAMVVSVSLAYFGVWSFPTSVSSTVGIAPGASFYLCQDGSTQPTFCSIGSINASTVSSNATFQVTWQEGNGTDCSVKFVDSSLLILADLTSGNQNYTLPNTYPAGATFGLRITRLRQQAGYCNLTINPTE